MKKTAIIPGSFDPMTKGHAALIDAASQIFERVVVAVCVNFDKKSLFSPEQRLEIAKKTLEGKERTEVILHTGWLYDLVSSIPDSVLVKGVRNAQDLEYENKMAEFNFEKCGVHTLYLPSQGEFFDLSSTEVRRLLWQNGDWKRFVAQNAQKTIEKFYTEK